MISRSVGDDAGNFWYFFEKFPGGLLTLEGILLKSKELKGKMPAQRCTGCLDLTGLQRQLEVIGAPFAVYRVPGFDRVTAYVLV